MRGFVTFVNQLLITKPVVHNSPCHLPTGVFSGPDASPPDSVCLHYNRMYCVLLSDTEGHEKLALLDTQGIKKGL